MELLDMFTFADAIVGILGEGLNVEQRKRLTIGVELAAKPPLLLFVDEPTSGLDSQTSWAILDLLKRLSDAGQAILCTIHQPSAMLFQRFDRLLLLTEEAAPDTLVSASFTLLPSFPLGATPKLTRNPDTQVKSATTRNCSRTTLSAMVQHLVHQVPIRPNGCWKQLARRLVVTLKLTGTRHGAAVPSIKLFRTSYHVWNP